MSSERIPIKQLDTEHRNNVYKALQPWETGYTIGVASLLINCVFLMRFPSYFWILHMVKTVVHLPWRYVRFSERGWEWYLADFCYANNYLIFICLCVTFVEHTFDYRNPMTEYNQMFIRTGFAFANGALGLAIMVFNNKLVFHDVDNTTSVFIHYSPAALFWTLRWGGGYGTVALDQAWPGLFKVCTDMSAPNGVEAWTTQMLPPWLWDSTSCPGNFTDFVAWPAICWLVFWGLPYYVIIFLCFGWGDLTKTEKQFLYRDTINAATGNGKLIRKLPESLWPIGYMLQHFLFSLVTSLFSLIVWHSFALHSAFLFGLLFIAIHNGSTYMFRVVAARKVAELVDEQQNRKSNMTQGRGLE